MGFEVATCTDCGTEATRHHEGMYFCPDCLEAFLDRCSECERSFGPHYKGACDH